MQGRYPRVTILQDNVPIMTHRPETTPLLSTTSYQQHEQKKRSLLPIMIWLLLLFTTAWVLVGLFEQQLSYRTACVLLVVPLLQGAWACLIMHLGSKHQYFAQESMLNKFPMVWLPLFPIVLQTTVFLTQPIWDWLEQTLSLIVLLQALRILAVGSLVKWHMGLFPTAFAWGTALPDMLFGLSSLWMAHRYELLVTSSQQHDGAFLLLLLWNIIGFVLIVPLGVLIVQLGMEPTRIYNSQEPYRLVFEYPMVLGPAVVVPTLLSWNVIMMQFAWKKLQE